MPRIQVAAGVTPEIAQTLKRLAAIANTSVSGIIEDAIAHRLSGAGHETEYAVLLARIDKLSRRLGVIEAAQETHFELTAQSTRFAMSIAPEIPEQSRIAMNARGAERLRNLLSVIVAKLSTGRSIWRDTVIDREANASPAASEAPQ